MIMPTIINDETAKVFIENLRQKKFMVCFMTYSHNRDSGIMIDIASTRYFAEDRFSISCRGTGYLDYMALEDFPEKFESIVKKYVHSFIECQEPAIKPEKPEQSPQKKPLTKL
jgi:hypothetical protein